MKLLEISKKDIFTNKIGMGLTFFSVALVICCLILIFTINEIGKKEIARGINEGSTADKVLLDIRVFTEKGLEGKPNAILSPIDLRLIKNSCPHVKEISFYSATGIDEMRIENKQYINNLLPDISGTFPEYIKILDIKLKKEQFSVNTILCTKS